MRCRKDEHINWTSNLLIKQGFLIIGWPKPVTLSHLVPFFKASVFHDTSEAKVTRRKSDDHWCSLNKILLIEAIFRVFPERKKYAWSMPKWVLSSFIFKNGKQNRSKCSFYLWAVERTSEVPHMDEPVWRKFWLNDFFSCISWSKSLNDYALELIHRCHLIVHPANLLIYPNHVLDGRFSEQVQILLKLWASQSPENQE